MLLTYKCQRWSKYTPRVWQGSNITCAAGHRSSVDTTEMTPFTEVRQRKNTTSWRLKSGKHSHKRPINEDPQTMNAEVNNFDMLTGCLRVNEAWFIFNAFILIVPPFETVILFPLHLLIRSDTCNTPFSSAWEFLKKLLVDYFNIKLHLVGIILLFP